MWCLLKRQGVLLLHLNLPPTHPQRPAFTHAAFHPLCFFFPSHAVALGWNSEVGCRSLTFQTHLSEGATNGIDRTKTALLNFTAQLWKAFWGEWVGCQHANKSFYLQILCFSAFFVRTDSSRMWKLDLFLHLATLYHPDCFTQSFSFCLSVLHKYSLQVQTHKEEHSKLKVESIMQLGCLFTVNSPSANQIPSCRLPWLHQSGSAVQSVITAV